MKYRFSLSVLLAVVLFSPLQAQDDQKTKQTVAMSQSVYEALQEAQQNVEAKAYGQVHADLNKLRQKKGLSPYELAQIWNLDAYTYYQEERYPQAISAYENLLAQGELPEALIQSTLKTMAQLYFTTENYDKALSTVQRLMQQLDDPSADIYMLLGQAYFQKGDYRRALNPITTAIDKYKAQGRTPKENWLLLLRVIHYEQKNYQAMANVLKELVRYYPKDRYFITLAAAYSELGDQKKQLVLTEALYEGGYLSKSNHLINLANLYLIHDVPYKAALILEKEMEAGRIETNTRHLRLLSQAWYQAREDRKAIPPLRRAAELSGDGELFVRLAQSHINLENWDEAVEAVREGLRRGGVKRPDTANVMLGMALFNQQKLSAARNAFVAARSDSRSARVANQWITHVDQELERRRSMNQEIKTRDPIEVDPLLQDQAS
ncbi:MAG: tetratricopeptide repeat protein [Gammaproteobacteria bacterium]|nr:tetratricopeptide repeat protein [Gammaproteobacteria bacterium]NND59827.1 tetratricopeptide repeat protein [Gammaproteobacteria bacterium]